MRRSLLPAARELPQAHVTIGDCAYASRPMLLITVLGSCVCATFHHPGRRAGGMFHAMLPQYAQSRRHARPCTFADKAVELLVERFREGGMPPEELTVKLFGGANTMLPSESVATYEALDVGRRNVEVALEALARHGLSPATSDVLGNRGRKLFFAPHTGQAWLQRLTPDEAALEEQ